MKPEEEIIRGSGTKSEKTLLHSKNVGMGGEDGKMKLKLKPQMNEQVKERKKTNDESINSPSQISLNNSVQKKENGRKETSDGKQPRTAQEERDGNLAKALQAKWDAMFDRLLQFKKDNGHCLVPNRYANDKTLGAWVSTQRRQYKVLQSGSKHSTPMSSERAERLNSIGFVWSTTDPRHTPFEERYKQLVQFYKTYGHALVPIGYKDNVPLSNWVSTQRQEYKAFSEGKPSRITPERVTLLNKLNFVWDAQKGHRRQGIKRPYKNRNQMQQSSASSSALPTECITKIDDRLGQVELFSVQGLAALRGGRDNLESKKLKLSPENNTKPTKNVIRSSQSKQETTKNGRVGQPSLPGSMFPNERFMGQSWLQSNPILAQALLNQTALEAGMTSILAQNFRVNGVVSLNVPARNVDETSPVSRCMESRNMGVGVQGISNKNTDSSNACDDKK